MLRSKRRLGAAFWLPSDPMRQGGGVSAGNMEPDGGLVAPVAALGELAEKLSKLRAHLDQVLVALHGPADRRIGCHQCGQLGSSGDAGWTLRLCADDELHAFCPECDGRYFSGNRKTM